MASLTDPWDVVTARPHHPTSNCLDVYRFLMTLDINPANCMLPDNEYSHPAQDWVENDFAGALSKLVTSLNFTYKPDSRDCDDFARLAGWYAQWLHSETPESGESALALGEFAFSSDTIGGHAIVMAIVLNDGEMEAKFYDPQPSQFGFTMNPVTLTPCEIASCSYLRF